MRKHTFLTLTLLLTLFNGQAQFYKTILPSPAFADSLTLIILDYRHNYQRIQAEELTTQGDADVYRSAVKIPGSAECVIYRFRSFEDSSASWQALMYKGESYKDAAKIYKNTFRLVNKTRINSEKLTAGFLGQLEEPTEDLRFTASTLRLATRDKLYKNYVAEVELVNSFDGWEVRLNLHYKKDDKEKY